MISEVFYRKLWCSADIKAYETKVNVISCAAQLDLHTTHWRQQHVTRSNANDLGLNAVNNRYDRTADDVPGFRRIH